MGVFVLHCLFLYLCFSHLIRFAALWQICEPTGSRPCFIKPKEKTPVSGVFSFGAPPGTIRTYFLLLWVYSCCIVYSFIFVSRTSSDLPPCGKFANPRVLVPVLLNQKKKHPSRAFSLLVHLQGPFVLTFFFYGYIRAALFIPLSFFLAPHQICRLAANLRTHGFSSLFY